MNWNHALPANRRNVVADRALVAAGERHNHGAILRLVRNRRAGIKNPAAGNRDVQHCLVACERTLRRQPAMAGVTEVGADRIVGPLGIVGKPRQKQYPGIGKHVNEEALPIRLQVIPGVIQSGIDVKTAAVTVAHHVDHYQVLFGDISDALITNQGQLVEWRIGIPDRQVRDLIDHIHAIAKNLSEHGKTAIVIIKHRGVVNQVEKPLDIVVNQAGYYGIPRDVALERAEKYLKQLQLWDKAHKWSRTLSGGMKRRLMIARAMVNEPRLLILDEPTAGVDIEIRRSMWDFVREINDDGTTVILTTHYLEEAESLCRNIAIIDHGEIVKNTNMKSLLATLDIETFVLDLREPLLACPHVEGMELALVDENTLEASLPKQKSLNNLFAELDKQGIHVLSMRNKANRLEELFLRLVDKGELKGEQGA